MNVREPYLFLLAGSGAVLLLAMPRSAARAQQEQQQSCMQDADCGSDFRCEYRDDEACVDRPGQPPDCTPPQEGQCEPVPITCELDDDCPFPLRCETTRTVEECSAAPASGSDAAAGAGGCTRMEVALDEPRCVFDLVACTQDTDCDADLPCQPIGRQEDCSSAEPSCAPGEPCAQQPPVCTERVLSYCFPRRNDCDDDGDCGAGWQCTELQQDAQEHPPPGWEGATRVCLPEGIALYLAGRVEAGASGGDSSDEAASGRADSASGGSEAQGAAAASADEEPSTGGACSAHRGVRAQGQSVDGRASAAALLALTLAFVRLRRRR